MTRNLLRRCTNCAQDIPATNHAADFLCDDCRRMKDEQHDREIQWKRDRQWVEKYIRQNWREMKKIQNEMTEAIA